MARFRRERFCLPLAEGKDRVSERFRVGVVGGGIAGAAAATVLAERGAQVTLFERESSLGGRAGGFLRHLPSGEPLHMERGFHAFFRQYYNLKALLRRVDPSLSMLQPLQDYPILGPEGRVQTFADLPKRTPFQLISLVARTPYLPLSALMQVNGRKALQMLMFDLLDTYRRYDHISAATYLDSLAFDETARRMLFDVFAHSFFNPESDMSAAELLMMFHFYFTGNPEGLVFDVAKKPLSQAIWQPYEAFLRDRGVGVRCGQAVENIEPGSGGHLRVVASDSSVDVDAVVLALDVDALKGLVERSQALSAVRSQVAGLQVTRPFAVLRQYLDRPVQAQRAPFAGTTGFGLLDNISVYNHFQDESASWSARHGGAVVELHAYAVPEGTSEDALRRELVAGLHALYPETRAAKVVDECLLVRRDCPAFAVGSHRQRPGVTTALSHVTLAGDGIDVPVPCALMERAAVSGILAANHLLAARGVRSEPVESIPTQGLLARPRFRMRGKSGVATASEVEQVSIASSKKLSKIDAQARWEESPWAH